MWLLEKEIKHHDNDMKLREALNYLGIGFIEIEKKPFENIDYDHIKNNHFDFVYASTNVIEELKDKVSGIYFNESNFNYHSWAKNYGDYLFNNPKETKIFKIKDFVPSLFNEKDFYFIRPVKDLKSFSGSILKKEDLIYFLNEVKLNKYTNLNEELEITISPAYNIDHEWRCFIVNKKVACVSQYKKNGVLFISNKDIPASLIEFSEKIAEIWSPDFIFTLDIGISGDKYYIIEAQCSNSSGFYDCDMIQLVKSINEAVK